MAGIILTAGACGGRTEQSGDSSAAGTQTSGTTAPIVTYPPSAVKENSVVYSNPVYENPAADPCVIRADDGTVYVYATQDEWEDGSLHVCAIYKSGDLINWEYAGDVFDAVPSWNDGAAVWATDILKVQDKYVFYYTLIDKGDSNPAIGAAVADHPAGPFTDMGKITDCQAMGGIFAIDPFPVYGEDGSLYLILGNYEQGSWYMQLSDDGLSAVTVREKFGPGFEGVYIIKRGEYYYQFGSLGTMWEGAQSTYHVNVSRSTSLLGPYVNRAGEEITEDNKDDEAMIMLRSSTEGERFFGGPGNNSILTDDDGVDWIIYGAMDSRKPFLPNGASFRALCVDPLFWDEDGWPYVEGGVPGLDVYYRPAFNK